jgi:hypothetical protein
MTDIRMRLGMWLYYMALRMLPPWARYSMYGMMALGEAYMGELRKKGEDVDAIVAGLLEKWQEERMQEERI